MSVVDFIAHRRQRAWDNWQATKWQFGLGSRRRQAWAWLLFWDTLYHTNAARPLNGG